MRPEEILDIELPIRRKGYDVDEVDDLLDGVAGRMSQLERELDETRELLRKPVQLGGHQLAEIFAGAQALCDEMTAQAIQIRDQAKREAEDETRRMAADLEAKLQEAEETHRRAEQEREEKLRAGDEDAAVRLKEADELAASKLSSAEEEAAATIAAGESTASERLRAAEERIEALRRAEEELLDRLRSVEESLRAATSVISSPDASSPEV
jgi:DivIVA domain-containing protein